MTSWVFGSVLVIWTMVNEISALRHRRMDRSMVKMSGSGHFCGWNLPLTAFTFTGQVYAVAENDFVLLAVCLGVLFVSNALFLYVGRDGVLIGGGLKGWPWQVYASMTDAEFEAIKRLGINIDDGGAGEKVR